MRQHPAARLAAPLALTVALACAAVPAGAAPTQPTVGAEASVSFPIAVPAVTQTRLAALARTPGRGSDRAAQVRALTPSTGRAAAVVSWAQQRGFRVVSLSPWLVEVRGPATALASALGTTAVMRTVHGTRYPVAVAALHVPAALRAVVTEPVGLDERPHFRHRASYGGGDVQVLQDLPVRGGAAGADVTVGTLNLSGWHPGDLAEYAAAYGLRVPPVQSVVVGAGHVQATAAEDAARDVGEVALDAEAIAGTAPGATQRMYFGGNTDADYAALLGAMADDAAHGLLQTASTSWGACEGSVTPSERALEAAQIDRMVAAGATFFAPSGDSGAYACSTRDAPDNTPAVDWPAAEANTVGVGGTSQTGDATSGYGAPTAWNLANPSGAFSGDGSGGGCSTTVAKPAYQTSGVCPTGRAVPDLAALADPATGYEVFDTVDGWTVMGGTSLAAPLSAAGLAAFLGSQADKHGVGNILTAAYANPTAFTDVTSGSNGAYSATAGYDAVTGLGVPDWRLLGAAIRNIAANPAAPAASNPFFTVPTTWNTLTVPFLMSSDGGRLDQAAVSQNPYRTCPSPAPMPVDWTNGAFTLDPGTADGPVTVTLTGQDAGMGCRSTTRSLFLDRHAPAVTSVARYSGTASPQYDLAWSFADAAPSSGLAGFAVKATDTSTGAVRLDLPWTTTGSAALAATAGHLYLLQVTAYDRAGNASAVRSLSFRAPFDDRSAILSTGWSRVAAAPDFLGSHVRSGRAGSTYKIRFTGTVLTAVVLTGRYGGYADVYVDGVRRQRLNLYATSTHYRQPVRLAAFATAAAHSVVVRVVGAHASGSLGNEVYLDSFTVT